MDGRKSHRHAALAMRPASVESSATSGSSGAVGGVGVGVGGSVERGAVALANERRLRDLVRANGNADEQADLDACYEPDDANKPHTVIASVDARSLLERSSLFTRSGGPITSTDSITKLVTSPT